jgi:hypothetical protein
MPFTHRVRFASQNVSIIVAALLLLFLSTDSSGQTTQTTTDKMTPSGITPGACRIICAERNGKHQSLQRKSRFSLAFVSA